MLRHQLPFQLDSIECVNYFFVSFHGDRDFGLFDRHGDPETFSVEGESGFKIKLCSFEEVVVVKTIELIDNKGELGRE